MRTRQRLAGSAAATLFADPVREGPPREARRTLAIAGALAAAIAASVGDPGFATERPIDADTVATGVVTKNGAPAGGVEVVAEVWPNQQVLDTIGDGDAVPIVLAAHTTTDQDGWFALEIDASDLNPDYREADGQIDISLTIADAANEIRWNFSAQRSDSSLVETEWSNPRLEDSLIAEQVDEGEAATHLIVDIGTTPR